MEIDIQANETRDTNVEDSLISKINNMLDTMPSGVPTLNSVLTKHRAKASSGVWKCTVAGIPSHEYRVDLKRTRLDLVLVRADDIIVPEITMSYFDIRKLTTSNTTTIEFHMNCHHITNKSKIVIKSNVP